MLCWQTLETMQHVLVDCPMAIDIWCEVLSWTHVTLSGPVLGETLIDWWLQAKLSTAKEWRKGVVSREFRAPRVLDDLEAQERLHV